MKSGQSEPNSKQIIFAWNYLEWGGAQIYFFGIIRRIKDYFNIKILLPENSEKQLINFIEDIGIEYEMFKIQPHKINPTKIKYKIREHWKKYQAEKELVEYLKKFALEKSIVHVELAPWESLFSLIRLCRKTEVFITMHNSLPPVPKWRYFLWKIKFYIITKFKSFHIFTSNEDAKKSLKPLVPNDFYNKITVTYTNVNPEEIDEALKSQINKEKLLEKHNLPNEKFLVFCVGQFIDRKGRWTFLQAAKDALEKDNDLAFVWISNSKTSPEDLKKINNFGLGNNFVLIPSEKVGKNHVDLFKLLRIADTFALASFQEGLPISLLEAMALGIPSISTNVNAIPEAIKNFKTGLLVEQGDNKALTKAILTLKNDDALRHKLSIAGRKLVLKRFNEIEVAKIAFEKYKRVL